MILYYVSCEWDMGFNIGGCDGVYSSKENLEKALDSAYWSDVDYNTWQEVEDDDLLSIKEVEG